MAAVRCSMEPAIKEFPMVSSELTVSQSSLDVFRELQKNQRMMAERMKGLILCKCPIQPCGCRKTDQAPSPPDSYSELLEAMNNNKCDACRVFMNPICYHDKKNVLSFGPSKNKMRLWDVGLDEVTTSLQVPSSSQELNPVGQLPKKKKELPKKSSTTSGKRYKLPNKRLSLPEEKKYQCDYCSNSFGYKHVLMNHVRTHTGEKPFECPEPGCGKRFTRDHHLRTHKRLHTGEKPFVCTFCDKRFVQVANLRRHLRVHQFKCDIGSCQASFPDPEKLHAHKVTHSASEPIVISEEKIDPSSRLFSHPLRREESPTHVTSSSNYSYYKFYSQLPGLPGGVSYERLGSPEQEEPEDLSLKPGGRTP